jgi:ubiquinone/menaquinone biosynthesis C-methylase UbiE
MLNIAREKLFGYPVKLVRGDGLHLPIADNSVDAVVGRWILWVMPDPERAIEEIVRVTKPGGQVLIRVR